jgi:hypothetical protein
MTKRSNKKIKDELEYLKRVKEKQTGCHEEQEKEVREKLASL